MFVMVFSQVCILLILIMVGFVVTKTKLLTEQGAKCCTDIVLIVVTPCVIIKSLIREFDRQALKSLVLSFVFSLIVQVLMILISKLIIRSKDIKRERVLQFGTIFSNCGFMSLPLLEALLGNDGVFYGSAYIIMFNLVAWSYGVFLMSGEKKYISPKKLFLNPGLIGLTIGIIIFIFSIPIPKIILSPINYISAMYTPIPMLIIGYHLAQTNVLKAFKDIQCILAIIIRLLICPLASIGVLYLCGVKDTMFISIIISASAPVSAMTTMFASKYSGDTSLSVDMVSLSTVLSLLTMPLLITLAEYIA